MNRQFLMFVLFSFLAFLSCTEATNHTIEPEPEPREWSYLGLGDIGINAIAVDPTDEAVLYAVGYYTGVFKSTDGGAVWDTLYRDYFFVDVVVNPVNPQTVYVTRANSFQGILRSLDGGENWAYVDTTLIVTGYESRSGLAIDPIQPEVMFVGTCGNNGGGLYRSNDGGVSWESIANHDYLLVGVTAIAIHPTRTNELIVGTGFGDFILKSDDAGATWELTEYPTHGSGVNDIAFDLSNPMNVYCGVRHCGFYSSHDTGQTWDVESTSLPDSASVTSISITREGVLHAVAGGGLYTSPSDSIHWSQIELDAGLVNVVCAAESGNIYVGADGVFAWR